MTTQGERTPTPGEGQDGRAGQRTGGGADEGIGQDADRGRSRRLSGRRAAGWIVVIGVVVTGGWIITRPMPGDYIPGLGPSTKDSTKTPPVVGAAPPRTDSETLSVDNYFPAQKPIEVGSYKARRTGARQGENCAEVLQDRAQDPLKDSGCQSYLAVSFSGQDRPVISSVTLLRFPDQVSAVKAAEALRAKPGSVAFILADAGTAPALPAGAKTGGEPRVETVGHYVTVTSSRTGDGRPAGSTPSSTSTSGAPGTPGTPGSASGTGAPPGGAPAPTGTPAPSTEQILDEATRAISYAAGSPFMWM
ncbi:hypothetical protein [Kitasatospora sp. NPDC097691]|uniref:hypothetical protein n=1 Tax=Kitasatospora sp. NPDC097691 TaxID=3157231 RepID=UPI00331DD94B